MLSPNSLGTGGFSVTNFTVLDTGVVGADTALLVAIETFCSSFTGGCWSLPGAFDSIKLNIGLSGTILTNGKTVPLTPNHTCVYIHVHVHVALNIYMYGGL